MSCYIGLYMFGMPQFHIISFWFCKVIYVQSSDQNNTSTQHSKKMAGISFHSLPTDVLAYRLAPFLDTTSYLHLTSTNHVYSLLKQNPKITNNHCFDTI